jgi:hypothetical protein
MLELQGMAATPEQDLEVKLGFDLRVARNDQPGPEEGGQRQKARHRAEESAELQRRAERGTRPGGEQRTQHRQTEACAAKP